MAMKSPTTSVKSREMIGLDAFSQRREVFGKDDTGFVPLPSPTAMVPVYKEVEPIITSNHGKTTTNFKRNTTGYSSFRESKTDENNYDYRPRKYSDNFTSELNQSDDVDYRYSAIERTRRLSKMRRDFLASNLHEPDTTQFTRAGTRASLPTGKTTALRYKFESLNIHKFPFAEPYGTPPTARKVVEDSPAEVNGKENEELQPKHQSLPYSMSPTAKVDHQKLFEELVKRYSPQRKPVNWSLPPTRPRIIGSVPKSTSSASDVLDKAEKSDENIEDDVFTKKENGVNDVENKSDVKDSKKSVNVNGDQTKSTKDFKGSLSEIEEKNDRLAELSIIQRQISKETPVNKPIIDKTDLSIPELIDRMTEEGEKLESHPKTAKKVKRKRSFLDKLLGRKKEKDYSKK